MRELDLAIFSISDADPLHRAKVALANGDRDGALRFWLDAREHQPELVQKSHDALEVLLGLEMYDEAQVLMQEGCRQFAHDAYYVEGLAEIASRRGDVSEAIRRYETARKAFPRRWQGYASGAGCLIAVGRLDHAEALLRLAVKRFPDQVDCRTAHARLAEKRGNWLEALPRWELVSDKFKHVAGDIGAARALMEIGRADEAAARLVAARWRHPLAAELVMAQAHLALRRGNVAEEVRFWEIMRDRFPLDPRGYRDGAQRLRAIGREEDAEEVLRTAIERFPQETWPAIEYAGFAHDRKDWPEAVNRWAALRIAWPNHRDGHLRGAEALVASGRDEEAVKLRAKYSC